MPPVFPHLVFASPKKLPDPSKLQGRVAVLDLGFCALGLSPSFESMTGPFLEKLGERLCAWVDHHEHPYHERYRGDPRFVLADKSACPACAPMVTEEVVRLLGPADTLVCHLDFDGIYSAVRWITGGVAPYREADADAVAVDTRSGELSPTGRLIDRALRARFQDEHLKVAVVRYLTSPKGPVTKNHMETIQAAARLYDQLEEATLQWASQYRIDNDVAHVKVPDNIRFDKTELLLHGQKLARVSIVENSGALTVASAFHSGINFLELFHLGGGMPTRVSIPASRRREVFEKLGCEKLSDPG